MCVLICIKCGVKVYECLLIFICCLHHITLKTPVLVRSPKLSNVEPGQYLDGWPPGNTGCCRHFSFLFSVYLFCLSFLSVFFFWSTCIYFVVFILAFNFLLHNKIWKRFSQFRKIFTPVAEAGHAARGDYSWRHNFNCSRRPLDTFCQCSTRRPLRTREKCACWGQFFVWMASRMHRLLTMELQIFQSFHDSKLSAQEKTEIILKSGSWTSFHLNAEVFEYKFSHIKFFVNKNILKLKERRDMSRAGKIQNLELSPVMRFTRYRKFINISQICRFILWCLFISRCNVYLQSISHVYYECVC